ncbi:MAG: RidA family protein [Lachnospiraceae bacterium]|nr:RidA family protein [Lachnospiraceae bacterium]
MKRLSSKGAPEAIGPYSQAIYTGKLIYTSGIIPVVPETGMIAGATIESQTEQVLKNLSNLLKDNGSSLRKVVKTTVFIKDMRDFKRVNDVYATFFSEPYPARSCVEVSRLPKDVKIELEAIAEKGESASDKEDVPEKSTTAKKTTAVKKTAAAKKPAAKKTTAKKAEAEPEISQIPVVEVSAEPEVELEEIKIDELKIEKTEPEEKKPEEKAPAAKKTQTAKKAPVKRKVASSKADPEKEPAAKKKTAAKKKADTAPEEATTPADES